MPHMLTKIVATLGPASDSPEMVRKLIEAGVGVFRLNFSHGTLDDHARRLATVRAAAKELRRPTAVLGDLQGPKIRVGIVPDPGIELIPGSEVDIRYSDQPASVDGNRVTLTTAYKPVVSEVEPGQRVLINDGAVRLLAIERRERNGGAGGAGLELVCRVTIGGLVTSKKGINLPDSTIAAPALTERDIECVHWAVAHGLDLLALSFVRKADEVRELKRILSRVCPLDREADPHGFGSQIPVIAKIEKPQAVTDCDSIMQAADAVMVARGDLGVEMDLARVPIVQKHIIQCAAAWGKPCIVATQMLESMITSPLPTRAEVSDVANAILDGAGAVMLSAETATGKHPLLAVEYMRLAALAAEDELAKHRNQPSPPKRLVESRYRTAALAHGAWQTAHDLGAKAIVCWSQRGGAARYLSENNFSIPILAFSSDVRETRRMQLLRSVFPLRRDPPATLAEFNRIAEEELLAREFVKPGDPVVLLAGLPLGEHAATNMMAIHYTSNPVTGFMRHT